MRDGVDTKVKTIVNPELRFAKNAAKLLLVIWKPFIYKSDKKDYFSTSTPFFALHYHKATYVFAKH